MIPMTTRAACALTLPFLLLAAVPSEACLPEDEPTMVSFETTSAEVSKSEMGKITGTLDRFRHLEARCVLLEVIGQAPDPELARARAQSTRQVLIQNGAPVENVTTSIVATPDDPAPRQTAIIWRMSTGKWRCVPARPKPSGESGPPGPSCPQPNTKCYLELADGTICNVYGVANPTPENYPEVSR